MRFRHVTTSFLSATLSCTALAQSPQAKTKVNDEAPPAVQQVSTASNTGTELLLSLLSVKPQIPLGPDYVLQGYESEMTLVSQKMSLELESIERALRCGQITHDEAEYLIQQRYQVAMMQYEVFEALHDALEQEIRQVADESVNLSAKGSVSPAAARLAALSSHSQNQ